MTGSLVFATEQGLGYLAKDFYDNGVIDLVSVYPHSRRKNHYEWYPDRVTQEELLDKCDTLLFFENAFNWKLIPKARERGIKTVLMPMYECTPDPLPYEPDEIIVPSTLDKEYYTNSTLIPVPVPNIEWRKREKARVFVHNAGNGGLGGRNGTKELLEAMKYVKSPIKLIIRSQVPIKKIQDNRIEYQSNVAYEDLFKEGDVFIFPEKFNGLSLPLQEAFSSGMLVMTTDRKPNYDYLPNEPLIPVKGYRKETISREFDYAEIDPKDIANTIDEWYDKDISDFSLKGKEFKQLYSWKNLKPKYQKILTPK